jgi:hypothetical protein
MADNTRLNLGSGGDLIRTEDLGTSKIAVSKIYLGDTGLDGGPVTPYNPLPVSVGNFPPVQMVGGNVSVLGTVTAVAGLTVGGQDVDVGNPVPMVPTLGGLAVSGSNPVPVSQAAPLPAGSNFLGSVAAGPSTGAVYNGATALTPKFAAIGTTAGGDTTLVAAVPGKKLRVLKYTVVTSAAVGLKFRSSSGADLTGAMPLAANAGVGGAWCPAGLFETLAGDALVLNLSAGATVAGHLTYIEV